VPRPANGNGRDPADEDEPPADLTQARGIGPQLEIVAGHGLPLWRELFTAYDWWLLRTSAVWFGAGVPRGDGSPVITIPGFLGHDRYMVDLHAWLERVGYVSYASEIGINADCPNLLQTKLIRTLERAHIETGRRVHLIGHSLGGILARTAATRRPDLVASVTTLGAPFRGIRSHPVVIRTRDIVRTIMFGRPAGQYLPSGCYTGQCTCDFIEALDRFPAKVRELAIYTRADGIVDWRMCVTGDPAKDREVLGTHIGLAFNPFAYQLIGEFLGTTGTP
jgi:triacylglycerol esterase/lipase EstA (alpha/beta hydrolase family)